jgi:hypothetical protein
VGEAGRVDRLMGTALRVITAASALVGALTVLTAALLGFFRGLPALVKQLRELGDSMRDTKAAVGEVHTLVNNQLDRQLDRNEQLTKTLTAANVEVPDPPVQA